MYKAIVEWIGWLLENVEEEEQKNKKLRQGEARLGRQERDAEEQFWRD